jgi:hypothetical protein
MTVSQRELLAALRLCRSAINEAIVASEQLESSLIRTLAKAAEQADRALANAEAKA